MAFAIDSPFFIREATKLRELYGIVEPFRQEDTRPWIVEHLNERDIKTLFEQIADIRARLILTANYQKVFEKAVFGCDIENGDYSTAVLVNFQKLPDYLTYKLPISEMYAILLTPQTRKRDVEMEYVQYCRLMNGFKKNVGTESLFDEFKDYRVEIMRDRTWFWEKKGKTYLQIAKDSKDIGALSPKDYKETVRKAVKAYSQMLRPSP